MKRIVVLGAGFAGLIAAVGAARKLAELGVSRDEVRVTVVNRDVWHSIRVRNYESDLSDVRVPLADVLGPIGVDIVPGEVAALDPDRRKIRCVTDDGGSMTLAYDRLVFALGSELVRPPIPGLAERAFDVDTYDAAARLDAHLAALPKALPSPGRFTALIVGAGLTGVEMATELATRLHDLAGGDEARVILADRSPRIGSNMGEDACAVIAEALRALGVETRTGVTVAAVTSEGAHLASGEEIAAATVVWCGGMRAHPLAATFPGPHDRFGRVEVDRFLKVPGVGGVFAAGDAAAVMLDPEHASVMSCQHARPMGRIAGHNVVCDLLGGEPIALDIEYYVTCLDLGAWGAVYAEGWERRVTASGSDVKRTKRTINRERIYPPRSRDPAEILAAAAPVTQAAPRSAR